jgi:Tetratricopeptide repeat
VRAAIVIAMISATAYAQPTPNANAHARRGVALYNLGKYAEAIIAFEDAYKLFQSDALLFNLAQAHRQLGHCEDALFYYKKFLGGTPSPALAAQVEALVPKLEAACRTKFERPAGPVSPPEAAVATAEPEPAAEAAPVIQATPPPVEETPLPRLRAVAGFVAGTVMSNRSAPTAGVKASLTTPIPWLPASEIGVVASAARLFRDERDRMANLTTVGVAARLSSEQPWARLTIGGDVGGAYISSLDSSSGVIPGVRRAGLWVPFVRAEVGVERTVAASLAVRVAVAASASPRSGPMLESMTEVDLCVGVRYER